MAYDFVTQKLECALKAMTSVIGADWIQSRDALTRPLLDAYEPDALKHRAGAVVQPCCTEEVRAIVRIAAEHSVQLWPVSRGCNLGYGGSAPLLAGSVILDLRRMNRILEVDTAGAFCVVEPGVGFAQLSEYLQREHIPLCPSIPGNPTGSLIGNALERGIGYHPYGEHANYLCGLEVVLPTGNLLRTGMGALKNGSCWHRYPAGLGAAWDQMFVQSNLGIVTRAGVWLMPEPEACLRTQVALPNFSDLEWAIESLAELRLQRLVEHPIIVGNFLHDAAVHSHRNEWHSDDDTSIPDAVVTRIMDQYGLGWWNFPLMLCGYPEVIRAQAKILERRFAGKVHYPLQFEGWVRGDAYPSPLATAPSLTGLKVVDWEGADGAHLFSAPVLPAVGRLASYHARRSQRFFELHSTDYCCTFVVGPRHVRNINTILFRLNDPVSVARAHALCGALIEDAHAHGYGEYRAHLDFMQKAADSYDFWNHAQRALNNLVKDAIDPAGILAPGKNGVWPKRLREPPSC